MESAVIPKVRTGWVWALKPEPALLYAALAGEPAEVLPSARDVGHFVSCVIPLGLVAGRPEPAIDLAAGTAVSSYASRYRRAVAC